MVAKQGEYHRNKVESDRGVLATSLTVEALFEKMGSERVTILDTRASYIFNGWSGNRGQTGGHIPGAINFSASWLSEFDHEVAIREELKRLRVMASDDIIVYGKDSIRVASELRNLGYVNLRFLNGGFEAWVTAGKNIARMDNYQMLVYPYWLYDQIKTIPADARHTAGVKVFETGWGCKGDYESGHIPSAVYIDTNEFEEAPIWNRKSDEEIEQSILRNGITRDTMVILYGRETTAAARIAVILKYAGVRDVRILDGGYKTWVNAGLEIEKGSVDKSPVQDFGARIPVNKDYIIDMDRVKEVLTEERGNLISIRSWAEYAGETSGYAGLTMKGRIPGSLYGQDSAAYRNVDGTMFNYELLQETWCENRIDRSDRNTFYCGTGWRAAETLIYADAMGWENISLYDGGWHEWSSVSTNPVETGEPHGCFVHAHHKGTQAVC